MSAVVHGKASSYTHRGCRCVECRRAANEVMRAWEARQSPADAPHGTRSGYTSYRCRCDDCRDANRTYMRDYMASRRRAAA